VSKKALKGPIAVYLNSRLAEIGIKVKFVTKDFHKIGRPKTAVVPIIHYGILGTNAFKDYECCYCVNSYYVRSTDLAEKLFEFHRAEVMPRLRIVAGNNRVRNITVENGRLADFCSPKLAKQYLIKHEIDPVLQVIGRVRPLTLPRQVIVFQMNDMNGFLPNTTTFRSLQEARDFFKIPRVGSILAYDEWEKAMTMKKRGLSLRAIAKLLGISKSKVQKILKKRCPQKPSIKKGRE
jgi:hypothetical protein